jgi:membrane protease YdiL (CAAX protease family)
MGASDGSRGLLARYQIALFFALVYPLSWWAVPYLQGGLIAQGPFIAALIVVALTAGAAGLRTYWRSVSRWRAGWWYAVGPAIVAGYLLVGFALNLLLGATVSNVPALPSIGLLIQLLLLGGLWEELGWTGYALPKLQEALAARRHPALFAALIVAVFRGLWHLPLIAYGKVLWFDAFIFSIAFQLIIAWLYNRSGSVPVVMTFHYASNVLAGGVMLGVFAGSARTQFWALFVACACVVALVLLWTTKLTLGYRRTDEAGAR